MRLILEIEVSDYEAPTSAWTEEMFDNDPMDRMSEAKAIDVVTDRVFALNDRADDTGVEVERCAVRNDKGQYWRSDEQRWTDG